MASLLLRGGTLATPGGERRADLRIEDGRIVEIGEALAGADEELDAAGLLVLPGAIDPHVHFNEPGRAAWEGIASGSAALAAGGGTLWADMPLNSRPVVDADAFRAKLAAAEASSVTDFALWAGLTPDSLVHLPELAELGAVGFKAFMSDSGLPEFGRADDLTLLEGMQLAADLGLPVAVHAESEEITSGLTARLRAWKGRDMRDVLDSRPLLAELEAVARALMFAGETGCRLHLVHLSSPRSVALVREARVRGVDASCETCPHYLVFDEEDAERVGARLKCAPPLRSAEERDGLWAALAGGEIDLVASDHSPCPPELKDVPDLFDAWGGVSGVQSTLATLLTGAAEGRLPRALVPALSAGAAAERLRLPRKGRLEPGYDADLALVEPDAAWTLGEDELLERHKLSPHLGRRFVGRVRRVLSRGRTVVEGGRVVHHERHARLVRPETAPPG